MLSQGVNNININELAEGAYLYEVTHLQLSSKGKFLLIK
jgi:hypothetical protein